jgi:prepilin-type N-terminal cleavage/methylation domain-containing protein
MKKNKMNEGFTLTELLAVLVILAIIALITYPIVTSTITNSKTKAQIAQYKEVKAAAQKYVAKEITEEEVCVPVDAIQGAGYLEKGAIKDPKDGNDLSKGAFRVKWDPDYNQYLYTFDLSKACAGPTKYTGAEFE